MFIKIRKERWGYILFDRHSRVHHFVETDERLELMSKDCLLKFLSNYFQFVSSDVTWQFIFPTNSELLLSAPIGMYMEVSSECNMNCSHCYKPWSTPQSLLLTHQFKRLIDELWEKGVFEIRICGNEPTTSPFLFNIAEHIKNKEIYLGINTNAYFDEVIQEHLINLKPDLLAISIDGNQNTHDKIRKIGSYDRAVSFLARLSKYSIKKRINTLISKVTIGAMENVVWLGDLYNAEVSFLPLRTIGKSTTFKEENAIDSREMLFVVREVMRLREKYPDVTLLTYFDILGEKATYHHSMSFNHPCPASKNGFIASNGDYFPCDFLRYLGDAYFCGNVTENGFYELWNKSTVLHRFQNLKHSKCQKCRFFMTHCYGGCISGSLSSSGGPDDELCFIDLL